MSSFTTTMESCKRSKLTGEVLKQLQEGVSLVFSLWASLQDAVNGGFAGPYTREKLHSFLTSVLAFFDTNEPLCIDDIEDLLYDGMDHMHLIDPNGVEEVAKNLMIMHQECLQGNYQSIQRLRELKKPVPCARVQVQAIMGDNDDYDIEDDVDASMIDSQGTSSNNEAAPNDMDVDGWVHVSRKKSKGRKK